MDKARVAVLISGRGSNMAALIYASRADDCPYEIVLVSGDKPAAPGLTIAAAEGIRVEALDERARGGAVKRGVQPGMPALGVGVYDGHPVVD